MSSYRRALAAAFTSLTLLLAACSADADTPSSEPGASSDEPAISQSGGTLTLGLRDAVGCLDPQQLAQGVTMNINRQVVDSLTAQDPETGEIQPWIASDWEISDDGTQFTFTIRDGVTFSDGEVLDAEAVKANFEGIQELGARSLLGSTYVAGLTTVEAPDASTVVFTFDEPNAQFLQATATITLGLLSPGTLALSPEDRCAGQLVGSGPFVYGDIDLQQRIQVTNRDDHDWPHALAGHEGAAYLDEVVFQIIPEASVRTGSLQSGQVQGIDTVQAVDQEQFESGGFYVVATPNPGLVTSLIPNEQRSAMSDANVRRAVQIAINRDEIRDTYYNESYPVATSPLGSATPGYVDLSAELEFDPEEAARLLDEAGWTEGTDGIRLKDGEPLTLSLLGGGIESTLAQQHLRAVGIDLQIREVDAAQYVEIQASGDYDLAGYNLTRADGDVLKAVFSTEYTNVPRLGANPLDDVLREVSVTLDPDARAEAIAEAQRQIVAESHAILLVEQAQVFAFSDAVQDVNLEASTRLDLYDTWLES